MNGRRPGSDFCVLVLVVLGIAAVVLVVVLRNRPDRASARTKSIYPPRAEGTVLPVSTSEAFRPATPRCPECGTELPRDSPEGLCPKCLLKGGLSSASGVEAPREEASEQPTLPPRADPRPTTDYPIGILTPAELAVHFPQLEILELLGQGGMGAVYKARQPRVDRLVALKILPPHAAADPAFAERFTREARALAKLNHPNIVTLYDFGEVGGLYYFLMEFVDGGSTSASFCAAGSSNRKRPCKSCPASARHSSTPTRRGSSTATSSRKTFSWTKKAG